MTVPRTPSLLTLALGIASRSGGRFTHPRARRVHLRLSNQGKLSTPSWALPRHSAPVVLLNYVDHLCPRGFVGNPCHFENNPPTVASPHCLKWSIQG
jgi:hypothetical protein